MTMANLINDNETLKKYVPNTLKEVAGDQYYFFASTMFPTLDVVHDLGYHEHIWAKFWSFLERSEKLCPR